MAGTIIVPWGDDEWRGIQVSSDAVPGFEDPGFDDSAWPTVALPLASWPWYAPTGSLCPIHSTHPGQTAWAPNSDFLLRRWIDTNGSFVLRFAVDNTAVVYFDGELLGTFDNEDPGTGAPCPERDDHAPQSGELLTGGSHLLAIRCKDRSNQTYFDAELSFARGGWKVEAVAI